MFDPLFADGVTSGAGEKVATFAVKCLAVGGGFLVGYFLGAVIAWALDRWVFANKSPAQLKKVVSLLCGVALAILVAMIVFGEGGSGMFGGRGNQGDNTGTQNPDKNGKQEPTPPAVTPKPDEPPKKKDETPVKPPDPKPMLGDLRVMILPDEEAKEGRFYQIDGDPTPKSLPEFKKAIEDTIALRRKESKPELKQVIFRFKGAKFSQNHPVVRDVVGWLSTSGIGAPFE